MLRSVCTQVRFLLACWCCFWQRSCHVLGPSELLSVGQAHPGSFYALDINPFPQLKLSAASAAVVVVVYLVTSCLRCVIKSIYKIQINCRQWAAAAAPACWHLFVRRSRSSIKNVLKSFCRLQKYLNLWRWQRLRRRLRQRLWQRQRVLIYFRWFVVIFGWHGWHFFFLCRAFININDVRRCKICFLSFSLSPGFIRLIISLLTRPETHREREKRSESSYQKLCQFVSKCDFWP